MGHVKAARATGAIGIRVSLPGLALDIDTLDDLSRLMARGPAGHVAEALARIGSSAPWPLPAEGSAWRPERTASAWR